MRAVLTRLNTRLWQAVGCGLLLVVGALLLWLPIHTQNALDDWAVELRAGGEPAQAIIYDRITTARGKTTMYFRYDFDRRTYEQEVPCVEVCRSYGEKVRIWVNRSDPTDFVTDFEQLSGHRGRLQAGLGAAGFAALLLGALTTLSHIPWGRWLPRRRPLRRASAVPGGAFTSRSKYKRRARR
ncbi:hypothetical protein [Micromonospora avicenniae]|uniref:DUF3592 domain-containing protein n=1 Tax=Micromonospora avicenniae TaxID=1198245 RepID=A0A1N6U1S6_9ACTN|nr:hypothetical protein [Micromonospora avicenniae]SIQ59585.1 hypothetical protein SAMN05444858_103186 [Micromonospora avicenniae]